MPVPPTAYRIVYADNLRAALKGRGLSCATAARKLATHEKTVRRWRNGEVEPRPEARVEIARLLDLELSWFYEERSDRELVAISHGTFEPVGAPA